MQKYYLTKYFKKKSSSVIDGEDIKRKKNQGLF